MRKQVKAVALIALLAAVVLPMTVNNAQAMFFWTMFGCTDQQLERAAGARLTAMWLQTFVLPQCETIEQVDSALTEFRAALTPGKP